jgi:hypothetical protein
MLALAFVGVRDLHDRGTPRSTWPLRAYKQRSPIAIHVMLPACFCGLFAVPEHAAAGWIALVAPLAGMAIASRAEPLMPNAVWLPRIAVALAFVSRVYSPRRPLAAGVAFAAIPASIARGAGEMERPMLSSVSWMCLFTGAALRVMLG